MRRGDVVGRLSNLSCEQAGLINKHWRLKALQPRERFIRFLLCLRRISHLQSNPREQQMREYGFPGERRLIEKSSGRDAETPSFKVPSFMEEQQALVQIDEPGPNEIFFTPKHVSRFSKALEGLNGLALLAIGRGFVSDGLRSLIAHPELFESEESFVGHFPCFFAQGQLQINIGKVQMT